MPRRELLPYLQDILERIGHIEEIVADAGTLEKLTSKNIYMDAFARNFEIIGEALNNAMKLNRNLPVTEFKGIIGLRHIIVHDYYALEYDRLWVIATRRLPQLKQEITHIIASEHAKLFGDDTTLP